MPKPLAFSGKQNSELVTRGWKSYLHVSPAKPRMASVTWRKVSQTGVIFWPARKQMWLYTRWDGIPAVNWDGDGHGLISVRARKELFACALSQCNRTHSMTGASQMERVCRCGLTAWSCTTFRRRQGRRPDVAEVVGFERASSRLLRPRPVARSLPSLGPLPRRFGEVPETIPLHLQRRGKRCKQRGLAEIVPYSSQIAAWQSHIYSSTVTAIRLIFNVILVPCLVPRRPLVHWPVRGFERLLRSGESRSSTSWSCMGITSSFGTLLSRSNSRGNGS